MPRPRQLLLPLLAVALVALPAGASAATPAWETAPLTVGDPLPTYPAITPAVEAADDGAVWVAYSVPAPPDLPHLVARRISPTGEVGAERELATGVPNNLGYVALQAVAGGAVRVAYSHDSGARLSMRRLTPTTTGAPVVVYDKDTTDDGSLANNGYLGYVPARLLDAGGGTSWLTFGRNENGLPIQQAARIAADDSAGVPFRPNAFGSVDFVGAANPATGDLVVVTAFGGGWVVANRVLADGTIEAPIDLRPAVAGSYSQDPRIGIDGSGVATVVWRYEPLGAARVAQLRRLTTTGAALATSSAITSLDDGVSVDEGSATNYNQFPAGLAVLPGGGAVLGWGENYGGFSSTADALVRGIGAGALPGALGARIPIDDDSGPTPEQAGISDVLAGPAEHATVLSYRFTNGGPLTCEIREIDPATGALVGAPVTYGTGNCAASGPTTPANALLALWVDGTTLKLARRVTDAPSCADGAPVTVAAGAAVTLPLTCTGWRPAREITAAPTRGTLGAIDDAAGTVTYAAGNQGGADVVRFRATNAAGASTEREIAITVTAPPTTGGPGPGQGQPGTGDQGQGQTGSPPTSTPAADATAPRISAVSLTPRALSRAARRAPVLRFTLSEDATVTVTLERLVPGRRVRGTCRTTPAPKGKAPGTKCVATIRIARSTRKAPAGPSKLAISLKRGGDPLPAGRYRVTVAAADAAGNRGKPARAGLTLRAR